MNTKKLKVVALCLLYIWIEINNDKPKCYVCSIFYLMVDSFYICDDETSGWKGVINSWETDKKALD